MLASTSPQSSQDGVGQWSPHIRDRWRIRQPAPNRCSVIRQKGIGTMANQKFIRVVNLERFQHYKDRNPPWIKLHRELLSSRTWVTSDDARSVTV